jgi:hypothetical protein
LVENYSTFSRHAVVWLKQKKNMDEEEERKIITTLFLPTSLLSNYRPIYHIPC